MADAILSRVYQLIETVWVGAKIWPEYASSIKEVLTTGQTGEAQGEQAPTHWFKLPYLCCQAAGGDPLTADPVIAAWLLFHLAADIMDAVEDSDPADEWWEEKGPGYALNVASGLYFTASLALNNLYQNNQINNQITREIAVDIYQRFLRMASGQHLELTTHEPNLDQCWKIAASKSGEFFAAGCRAGARLATGDLQLLEEYEEFGYHLGLLIQILDDLDEIESICHPIQKGKPVSYFRSIAVAYSLNVLPPSKQDRLREILIAFPEKHSSAGEAWELITESGVGLYLRIEMERHRSLALDALKKAQPHTAARDILESMVNNLIS